MKIIFRLILINLILANLSFSMSSEEVDVESASSEISSDLQEEFSIKLKDYYHQDTKTLDLSNLPLKDSLVEELLGEIKELVELTGAESLILENNSLTKIPYELITFALINKTLKYVSFKNNKFKIQNGGDQPEEISSLLAKFKDKKSPNARGRSNTISGVISTIWDGVSPSIEKAIENSNKSSDNTKFIKKIIVIDKRIPPITIINQGALPQTTSQKCKEIFGKIFYVGGGVIITLIPTLITYFSGETTCDMDSLNSMMSACNITTYY